MTSSNTTANNATTNFTTTKNTAESTCGVKLFCVPKEIKGSKKFEAETEVLAAVEKAEYMCPVWGNQASFDSVDPGTRGGTDTNRYHRKTHHSSIILKGSLKVSQSVFFVPHLLQSCILEERQRRKSQAMDYMSSESAREVTLILMSSNIL